MRARFSENAASYGPRRPVDIQSTSVARNRSICAGPDSIAAAFGLANTAA